MKAFTLVGGPFEDDFFPFSLTRSVADIRCGILTIREKWNHYLKNEPGMADGISVPANIIPDPALIRSLSQNIPENSLQPSKSLLFLTDILRYNEGEIINDFDIITKGRMSQPISSTNKLMGKSIFLEPGAVVEHCILNSDTGPIYIGKHAHLMEGSMIRGPFALGEKGLVKMGAKIYGATSAGPSCVLGGEIKNSVFFGYSNKSHDGYLGDSVLGEWCNLGAGSSNSNLKNSAGNIKLWNPLRKSFLDGGLKCGLMMGDYSRSAINISFSTGTVTGVCCHVFGNGPTPTYLPSFSWSNNESVYDFNKAVQHINRWKKLKGQEISPEEIGRLKNIFDQEKQYK
jgi:UDP-N-acetylglucosamine diphosphorylase / glucose-1-phosphate thymidylyltransferase / UDP-N-acetylgalactosamine diphosphorylase / glucosamine-1-phosphate N-acetyltransferase / galactosamine-1-phosphate N-acetyltransferase